MGKVGASILGGAVGFFTGGVGGAIAGAAQPWVTPPPAPPPPPAQTRTGATIGGPSAPGYGVGGAGLPTMTGSGLGTMSPSSLPGAPEGSFYGTPATQPTFRYRPTYGEPAPRAAAPTSFAARARARRAGGGMPTYTAPTRYAAPPRFAPPPPPPSPYLAPLSALAGYLARPRPAPEPRAISMYGDDGGRMPSGAISMYG